MKFGLESIDTDGDEQPQKVEQTTTFTQANEAHRANALIEMPAQVLIEAIKMAEHIRFDKDSKFRQSIEGVPGGMERHPALRMLCLWWGSVRPEGEPYPPGVPELFVRVRDDGEYWNGYYEAPNVEIDGCNPGGRDAVRIGDLVLVRFMATQKVAVFDNEGMHLKRPSGPEAMSAWVSEEDFKSGAHDQAWYCLVALQGFRSRFPAAWRALGGV